MAKAFANNTARLAIVGDNPMLLAGEDAGQGRAREQGATRSPTSRRWKRSPASTSTGTSSPIPAPSWAKLVFPRGQRGDGGGEARRTRSSRRPASTAPIRSPHGPRTTRALPERTAWLNGHRFARAAFHRPRHRSDRRPRRRSRMAGRRSRRPRTASPAIPNIPTEEVFTTPHARRVSGHVSRDQAALLPGHADRQHRGALRGRPHRRGEGIARRGGAEKGAGDRRRRAPPRRSGAGAAFLADLEERALVLQHAVRRERRLPHRAWAVLLEVLRRRRLPHAPNRSLRRAATRASSTSTG